MSNMAKAGFLAGLCLMSAIAGLVTANASPVLGGIIGRAILATFSRAAAPVVLLAAIVISFVVRQWIKGQPTPSLQTAWKLVKLAWKVYGLALLALLGFLLGVVMAMKTRTAHLG